MNKINIFIDTIGNTFNMWMDDPKKSTHSEMNKNEDILMMDKNNKVIGFEKINFLPKEFVNRLKLKPNQTIKKKLMLS